MVMQNAVIITLLMSVEPNYKSHVSNDTLINLINFISSFILIYISTIKEIDFYILTKKEKIVRVIIFQKFSQYKTRICIK